MPFQRTSFSLLLFALFSLSGFAQLPGADSLPLPEERPQYENTDLRFRITGCVHNQTGVALESARVEAHDLENGTLQASAYTNGNGIFELTGLRQGVYELVTLAGVNEARQKVSLHSHDTIVYIRIAIDGEESELTTVP